MRVSLGLWRDFKAFELFRLKVSVLNVAHSNVYLLSFFHPFVPVFFSGFFLSRKQQCSHCGYEIDDNKLETGTKMLVYANIYEEIEDRKLDVEKK